MNPSWWAQLGSNQRPFGCKPNALPLSYAPGASAASRRIGSLSGYRLRTPHRTVRTYYATSARTVESAAAEGRGFG